MIYLIDNSLIGDAVEAQSDTFLEELEDVLGAGICRRLDQVTLDAVELGGDDVVVLCNPPKGSSIRRQLAEVLTVARANDCGFLPVALRPDCEEAPSPLERFRAFPVFDFQLRHAHKNSQLRPAAEALARLILARHHPTCYVEAGSFVLAYVPSEGREAAMSLDAHLSADRHSVFRPAVDSPAGEHGWPSEMQAIRDCNAVVFLETKSALFDPLIEKQLALALESLVPIVWIRIDPGDPRIGTPSVLPAGQPNFEISIKEIDDSPGEFAAQVLAAFFDQSRPLVSRTLDTLRFMEKAAPSRGIAITALDPSLLTFRVEWPVADSEYEGIQRHVTQLYGRRPSNSDPSVFRAWLQSRGLMSDEGALSDIDHAIILEPSPAVRRREGVLWRDDLEKYARRIDGANSSASTPVLLLSGSFPEGPADQAELSRAIVDIAECWLELGGGIVMGGHPTFTPLVVGAATRQRPGTESAVLTIYQSEFFSPVQRSQYGGRATFEPTHAQTDEAVSLTLMRQRMVRHPGVVAGAVLGGKGARPGYGKGIDEEVDFMRSANIPVVVFGAPGGRAAEIAGDIESGPGQWSQLAAGPVTAAYIGKAAFGTEYRGLIRELHQAILADDD